MPNERAIDFLQPDVELLSLAILVAKLFANEFFVWGKRKEKDYFLIIFKSIKNSPSNMTSKIKSSAFAMV